MIKERLKLLKVLVSLLLIVFVFSFFSPAVFAIGPFGGQIIVIIPCDKGKWIILGPPVAGTYMFGPGSHAYLFGPPSHPGQWLLGLDGPILVCTIDGDPYGEGNLIIMEGSSM
jgi:hypothetical protein